MTKVGWHNWSGSVQCNPAEFAKPRSLEELARLAGDCRRAGRRLRVVGAGHSFTALVATGEVLVSLDYLTGVESVDADRGRATVWAGTRLKDLGEGLYRHGVAQENLGDIDEQSIAGAISTGTHGTGIKFGSIATQAAGLTLVTADGQVVECSPEQNGDLFKAAQVSMGALGVIAKITLKVQPSYRLKRESHRASLDECLKSLDQNKRDNRNFEFFWFPYSDYCQAKVLNESSDPETGVSVLNRVMENRVFWLLSESCRLMPSLCRGVSRLSGKTIPNVTEVNHSHRIFPTPRLVRFQEMEYNIPAEQFSATIQEIRDCIDRQKFAVHFPVECRWVRADDIWLSPATGRDSAYIAVHMYRGMPYRDYFDAMEKILQKHEGRPHWGKMHTMTPEQFSARYPRWPDFLRLRAELDPTGMFLNPYLEKLFGLELSKPPG